MYRIYYAGRRDTPEHTHDRKNRTEHGNKMCDISMGLQFALNHGVEFPTDWRDFESFGYTYIATTTLMDREELFATFQGEYINKDLAMHIAAEGAIHTSMSVGDILVSTENGRRWFCDTCGWTEV